MRYQLLGRSGLRVSEICLGTMTFGKEWGWGADKHESFKIFDAYAHAGGNFIDTANRYTEGSSEKYLGEFIEADRDHWVVGTKFTLKDRNGDLNFAGNHRKNMFRSVTNSLKRLNTDYIDLLWVHLWDNTTRVDEVLRGLDDLISRGMVHYIGISDTPAWIVSQSNAIADLRGWNAFTAIQFEYSLLQRTPERDLLPMSKALDLAVTPWGAIGGGALTGKYLRGEKGRVPDDSTRRNEKSGKIAQTVVDIADEMGVTPAQVAINWTRHRNQVMIPIIGASRSTQIQDSLGCLDFTLPEEMINRLNLASAIELGFPHEFLKSDGVKEEAFGGMFEKLINHRL
ncbi:aryl-alcohol dehydrogenase-like predicted oxidoreductase [Dyadobacter jejuensis]|uniref:Aryl-alcohol dehydrogenase-like predicted oxidoreductase n=1 Tax=Dyadobacter jejuensis TaxID=1082580 RepID=A0A316AIN8_9BACT|nr:aldo/keto reductase [Dyadobacter jejuensis]PWJ56740.1 aryl-alcohol dehydrogenase-like predicted oxidoreductase [Dyadobacter jejuensis]